MECCILRVNSAWTWRSVCYFKFFASFVSNFVCRFLCHHVLVSSLYMFCRREFLSSLFLIFHSWNSVELLGFKNLEKSFCNMFWAFIFCPMVHFTICLFVLRILICVNFSFCEISFGKLYFLVFKFCASLHFVRLSSYCILFAHGLIMYYLFQTGQLLKCISNFFL